MSYADQIQIEASWKKALYSELEKPYFREIKAKILAEKSRGKVIYPPGKMIFHAFDLTPYDQVKVVILGQDPYHGPGQAHGLCFSVPEGIKPPPSLVNIFKEIHVDLGIPMPVSGNLERWARQGVLLLNAILTVNASEPASHKSFGWEIFTDAVIRKLSEEKTGLVFLLWGRFAIEKQVLIDQSKHTVLTAPHPSPFSAHTGFLGCKHFSKTNEMLKIQGTTPINW